MKIRDGVADPDIDDVNPWLLIGSIEGRLRAGSSIEASDWNRMVEHALTIRSLAEAAA